jgi:surfeit locus 1 family protein
VTDTATYNGHSGIRRWLMLAALVIACLATAALGLWQVQRLAWKQDLIARVDARVTAAPVAPPARSDWPRINARDHEFLRLTVAGRFLHDKEALVVASTERGPGYWVMTPLALADGSFIVVNRGFAPAERRAPSSRAESRSAGETTVTGLLRLTEAGQWILRANDAAAERWYRRDPAAIAAARGLSPVAPYFIDADATPNPGGWPVGGMTRIAFSNNHLIYALTWFALAALAAAAAAYLLRTDFRRRRPPHSAASM